MIITNSKVVIAPSEQLSDMRLSRIVGRHGRVIQVLMNEKRKNKGYIIHFPKSFLGEKDWFIPLESVQHDE